MQPQNRISPTLEIESPESSSKRTQLLTNYLSWLKIAGLHYSNREKTGSICKTSGRVVFAILSVLNILCHIGIAAFCIFILIMAPPTSPEEKNLSCTVLILCATSALCRLILFYYLKKYFSPFSDHLLQSVSEQSQQPKSNQSKCGHFKFLWPIVILVIPLAAIVALFAFGIANAVSYDWESQKYITMKLGFHILIHQTLLQQVAIFFAFTGTSYYCCRLLKNISTSIKNLSTLEGEHLGLSIRSFCNTYSDFTVLVEEFTTMLKPVITVLAISLCVCLFIGTNSFGNQIDVFEICELGIGFIVGICALPTASITFSTLVDDKADIGLCLMGVKLHNVPDEFKIDLCIFQGRMFQPLANELKIFAAMLTTIYKSEERQEPSIMSESDTMSNEHRCTTHALF